MIIGFSATYLSRYWFTSSHHFRLSLIVYFFQLLLQHFIFFIFTAKFRRFFFWHRSSVKERLGSFSDPKNFCKGFSMVTSSFCKSLILTASSSPKTRPSSILPIAIGKPISCTSFI